MKSIYELGLDKEFRTERLGCVMLNTTSPLSKSPAALDPKFWEYSYVSENPNYPHINGITTDHHMTLHYGFLPEVTIHHLTQVHMWGNCSGIEGLELPIKDIEVFPSSNGEEYECVVARIQPTERLLSIREQFRVLPNLSTFPYKPHVTIGYFKTGFWSDFGAFHLPLRDQVIVENIKLSEAKRLVTNAS